MKLIFIKHVKILLIVFFFFFFVFFFFSSIVFSNMTITFSL